MNARAKLSVLHVCDEVGLGGTERGIVSMCRRMRNDTFEHGVLCLKRAGARALMLKGHADLQVTSSIGDVRAVVARHEPDAVIFHRAGDEHQRWNEVLELLRSSAARRAIIEVNIFGLVDMGRSDDLFDHHLHISKSSYCAFRRRAEASSYGRMDRHRVLYIPIEIAGIPARDPSARVGAREALGLAPDGFVLLRTGRPDVRKWGDLLLDALPLISERVPEAQFVFLSAPTSRSWYMKRRPYARRVRVLPPSADDQIISQAYCAADVYFHSSRRGESYGASLVEAMGWELPVVVDSTPRRDNAQVEVVDHMHTGIIANSPGAFADAIAHLYADPTLRVQMGSRAREKALSTYDAEVVCRSLAGLIGDTLSRKGCELPTSSMLRSPVYPSLEEIELFWSSEEKERAERLEGTRAEPLALLRATPGLDTAGRRGGGGTQERPAPMNSAPVSTIIFTLNEEIHLPACLGSLGWCDDVIVVDSLSTDGTERVARAAGARFFSHAFEGFGTQRTWALANCAPRHPWVLILDADEVVTPELARELQALGSAPENVGAYRLKRRFHMWGRWLRYSSLYPSWVVRVVRVGRVNYVDRGHAETQDVVGTIGELSGDLIDENLKGVEEWYARQNRYSAKDAEYELSQERVPFRAGDLLASEPLVRRAALKRLSARLPMRPLLYFLYAYVLRGGFRDGRDGLAFCRMKADYQRMIVTKKHDLERRR